MSYNAPQINFALQIAIVIILFGSLAFKQKKKFALHGIATFLAVVLNAFSFVWIMVPAFTSSQPLVLDYSWKIISLIHGVLGIIAEALGIFLLVAWALERSAKGCFKRKNLMRVTFALWFVALVLGILLYTVLYGIITL